MEVRLFGAAKEVTGSCYGVSTKEEKILIDCGMFQGSKDLIRLNYENFMFDPKQYDALILTHAHLDHCGRIPKLVKDGFRGKIYCTNATKDLTEIIMLDSAKIAKQDTEHENKVRARTGLPPRKPIYNDMDVKTAMKLFKVISYGKDIEITKNIVARFYDAGHILGAASIRIEVTEGNKTTSVAFSGDIGQEEPIIVKDTEPIKQADYVFIESTYGDRLHPPLEERKKEFMRIINETYKRGGKLMIPSFAVERAQELLYYLGDFEKEKLIPKMDVYLDSPMAQKATAVFTKYPEYYNDKLRNDLKKDENLFDFPGLKYSESVEQSKAINVISDPIIIIAGNGMCTAGRIKHHIRNNIGNPNNTLLFVGYQAEGSLGYWIKKGEKKIKLLGIEAEVKSKIESLDGFSAHADYLGLIRWLKNFTVKPKEVIICHGEETQSIAFSKRVQKEGMNTYIPSIGEVLTF